LYTRFPTSAKVTIAFGVQHAQALQQQLSAGAAARAVPMRQAIQQQLLQVRGLTSMLRSKTPLPRCLSTLSCP
jgi:hypothetical protein